MSKRAILSLPEESLEQADQLASELHVSRAEFIRRAVSAYAEELRRRKEEGEIRREREEAFKGIRELQKYFHSEPGWDPVKIIRKWRDKGGMVGLYEKREVES